jgi:glycosyltransferase involved in cell wall biosynthesis
LLDLAALLPDVTFDVAGMPDREDQYSRDLLIRAADTPNVVVHGRVPRSAMPAFYRRAALLCSTSSAEGFPNTFLESWSFGKPVVSTFDPDNIIRDCSLGAAAADVQTLAAEIRRFLSDPEAWTETSRRARAYFVSNHSFDSVMKRFEQVLTEVLDLQTECGEYSVEPDEQSISATTEK